MGERYCSSIYCPVSVDGVRSYSNVNSFVVDAGSLGLGSRANRGGNLDGFDHLLNIQLSGASDVGAFYRREEYTQYPFLTRVRLMPG